MPRRKVLRIKAAELAIYKQLCQELGNHPTFQECDFSTIKIVALKRNPPPKIKDVESPIRRLKWFIDNNGNRSVGKTKLCEIMKISRPTLNKWINDKLISRGISTKSWGGHRQFDLESVIKELEKEKITTKN